MSGGGRGIRTPGRLPYSGFQDRRLRPLGHPSGILAPFPERPDFTMRAVFRLLRYRTLSQYARYAISQI